MPKQMRGAFHSDTDSCSPAGRSARRNRNVIGWRDRLYGQFHAVRIAQGIAKSESGQIQGPWLQSHDPLFEGDGGHGMIFKTFDDEIVLALHSPNDTPNERVMFVKLKEDNGQLTVVSD